MADVVVKMDKITKKFGNFVANDQISFELHQGEILALLGENGAGKSTIMNILSGLLKPTNGDIYLHGKKVAFSGPRMAKKMGIGMVHQHFMLIPAFTVLENIILGDEPLQRGVINFKKARKQIEELMQQYELDLNLEANVADISVGMQQRVEIMKALYRQAEVLIFDEPTASLTPQEIEDLLIIFNQLIKEGKSIIFITHKLSEIKRVADNCVVIRNGKVVKTVAVSTVSETELAELMVGHPMNNQLVRKNICEQVPTLVVKNLSVKKDNRLKVNNLSLSVNRGEIVGIAGVDGNGQSELIEAIAGLSPKTGEIKINNCDISKFKPRQINEVGLGFIPEDRQNVGLILPLSVEKNLVLNDYQKKPFTKRGFLQKKEIANHATELIKKFGIKTQTESSPVADLSGGNQQKVIIAREIDQNPDILIAANPTRGVDVGAIEYIHQQLMAQRNAGHAILLVSFELEEILKLSDRILVIHEGEIVGEVTPQTTNSQELGLLMAGRQSEEREFAS